MSRTGPAYVESESELFADLERKQQTGDISKNTAEAFTELYEFAKDISDEVSIGEAKNANFQMKVGAHQGSYQNDPSVVTANVAGELQIWPARMVMDNAPNFDTIGWDKQEYYEFETALQSLKGVPQSSTTVKFDAVGSDVDIDQLKSIIGDFVRTCREKSEMTS